MTSGRRQFTRKFTLAVTRERAVGTPLAPPMADVWACQSGVYLTFLRSRYASPFPASEIRDIPRFGSTFIGTIVDAKGENSLQRGVRTLPQKYKVTLFFAVVDRLTLAGFRCYALRQQVNAARIQSGGGESPR